MYSVNINFTKSPILLEMPRDHLAKAASERSENLPSHLCFLCWTGQWWGLSIVWKWASSPVLSLAISASQMWHVATYLWNWHLKPVAIFEIWLVNVFVDHFKNMSYCHVDCKNLCSYGLGKQLESECLCVPRRFCRHWVWQAYKPGISFLSTTNLNNRYYVMSASSWVSNI